MTHKETPTPLATRPANRGTTLVNMAAFVVVMAGISAAKSLIIPFLLACFLAVICAPPLFWLRKKGVPSVMAVLLLVLMIIGFEAAIATLIGTSVADFTHDLPSYQQRLKQVVTESMAWLEGLGIQISNQTLIDQFDPGKLMGLFANTLNKLSGLLTNTFMILLTFVFILLEAAGFPRKLRAIIGSREASLDRYQEIMIGINRYLELKTILSFATGFLIYIFLLAMQIDYPILWALVAFLLNYVPTIGSIIAAVPAVLFALIQFGMVQAAITAGGYVVVNMIIGNVIEPRVLGTGVGLSTLVVFVSMTFWGWILGPVGMLLSVPLTMTLKIALSGNESTRWLAILLGTDREADMALTAVESPNQQDRDQGSSNPVTKGSPKPSN